MVRSKEEHLKLNEVSPELVEALKKHPMPQFNRGPGYREERAGHLRKLRHLMPVGGPIPDQVAEQEHAVTARDGYKIKVVSYCPVKQTEPGPLIILFHEGGWAVGDLSDEEFNARLFTRELGATCLNVEYRLAPEDPFPLGIHDCWDVVQWAATSASSLGTDPTKGFILGGSSAGGNISGCLAHVARNSGLQPPVTGQWLSVPYLMPSGRVPEKYKSDWMSMLGSPNDPVLKPSDDMDPNGRIRSRLAPDMDSPFFSVVAPENYPPTQENQQGKSPLARAYFQVAGLDPLRDHALVYDRILREEYGVETKMDLYPGFGHMFWTNWPEMEMSKRFSDDSVNGIKWLLNTRS